MWISAIIFLRNNWRWILPYVGAGFLFLLGWQAGANHIQKEWDASAVIQRELTAAALERDRQAAQAQSVKLEGLLAAARANVSKLNRRLSDEIKNDVYHSCAVPSAGVSLLNDYRRGAPTK